MCRGARVSLLYLEYFSCLLLSCVNLSMLSLILSFSPPEDLSPRTMPQDYLAWWLLAVPSPLGHAAAPVSTVLPAAMESWPVHRTCYLSQTFCFQLYRDSRIGRDTLNDQLWKANWHLLLMCWPDAPSTTTVIIIFWPCWSSMNIWTSWPCFVIIDNMFVKHKSKCTAVKSWSKPQEKMISFEPELNQRPKDCYNYYLQSSALPTELSKVDK